MDYLDVNDLNVDLYFEFYIQEELFFRYSYFYQQTEISLYNLCKEITHQLHNLYNYKIFTGYSYDISIVHFGVNASVSNHCILDIHQNDRYSKDFPLNMLFKEDRFLENLYLNMILIFSSKIKPNIFRDLLYDKTQIINQKSHNPIWPVLYTDMPVLSPYLGGRINRYNSRIQVINKYTQNDYVKLMKLKLVDELLKFNALLDKRIERTLSLYALLLKAIQKQNINRLRVGQGDLLTNIFEVKESIMSLNSDYIKFCYGEIDLMSDEQVIEYIKYFTKQHFDKLNEDIDFGKINYYFRNRYNSILDLKNKISESILSESEKLS